MPLRAGGRIPNSEFRYLVTGHWLLVTGYWSLVSRHSLLITGTDPDLLLIILKIRLDSFLWEKIAPQLS